MLAEVIKACVVLDHWTGTVSVKRSGGPESAPESLCSLGPSDYLERVSRRLPRGLCAYTDNLLSYRGLDKDFAHEIVDHAAEYVRGEEGGVCQNCEAKAVYAVARDRTKPGG